MLTKEKLLKHEIRNYIASHPTHRLQTIIPFFFLSPYLSLPLSLSLICSLAVYPGLHRGFCK